MKLIIAVIKPKKVTALLEELQTILGIRGLTIAQVQGFEHIYNLQESDLLEPQNYSRVEIVVTNDAVDDIRDSIIKIAYTGLSGDGGIVVTPIDLSYRIATKELMK